jgi:hypothetical protein
MLTENVFNVGVMKRETLYAKSVISHTKLDIPLHHHHHNLKKLLLTLVEDGESRVWI